SVTSLIRAATAGLHDRLEQRLDAVAELADPARRPEIIRRYGIFYASAHEALDKILQGTEGLRHTERRRIWKGFTLQREVDAPSFPEPADRGEALGSLYVVEGSTLGGRIILRELRKRGVEDQQLAFLDPYGPQAGAMWRALTDTLEQEVARGSACVESICRGAVRAFAYAETVLCADLFCADQV